MSITVKEVTKKYGEQLALNDVSFSIQTGEVVGFLGPNGAGKSTLMKIITCYLSPTSGQIDVAGLNVAENDLMVRKKVGYLPEHNPLYLDMYVKEYLEFVAGIYQLPNKKERIDEMIRLVGLKKEQHKLIGALSKGYRQRVGLAQAMIHDPEVLILDEPTSGLDPNQLVEIRNLIKTIGKEKTVMLSTHIMQEVEAICDRVIIIHQGRVVADEKASDIGRLSSGTSKIRVEFSGSVAVELLGNVRGAGKIQSISEREVIIESISEELQKNLFEFAIQNEITIETISKESMNLEDVFMRLTSTDHTEVS